MGSYTSATRRSPERTPAFLEAETGCPSKAKDDSRRGFHPALRPMSKGVRSIARRSNGGVDIRLFGCNRAHSINPDAPGLTWLARIVPTCIEASGIAAPATHPPRRSPRLPSVTRFTCQLVRETRAILQGTPIVTILTPTHSREANDLPVSAPPSEGIPSDDRWTPSQAPNPIMNRSSTFCPREPRHCPSRRAAARVDEASERGWITSAHATPEVGATSAIPMLDPS